MSAGTEAMRQRAEPPVERSLKRARAIPGFNPRAEDALAHLLARIPTSWLLLTSTVLTAGIYAALVMAFPITRWWNHPHLANDPSAVNDLGRITHYSPFAATAFVAAILLLCWCQFLAISAIARPTAGRWRPVGLAAPFAFAGALVWMQPVTTTDLYGYVARGYLLVQLHLNPMTNPAFLLPGNLQVNRPPAPYGPAWLLLCGLFSMVAGNNLLLNMLLFKLFSVACLVLSSWLLYRLAQRMEIGVPATVVMFFTWNPLVLFEAIGNGHNDIAMMTCVLAALLLTSYRHPRSALALLVFGALIKYTAALLIPLWLVYELNQLRRSTPYTGALAPTPAAAPGTTIAARRGQIRSPRGLAARTPSSPGMLSATGHTVMASGRAALSGLAQLDRRAAVGLVLSAGMLGVALTIAFYAPFWEGFKTFTGVGQQLKPLYYNGSLVQFVAAPLELLVPLSHYASLDKTVRLLFYAIFAVYAWLQVHRLWMAGKQATLRDMATAGAKTFFAALLLIAFWFQPWYVIWLLALAALANKPFVRSQAAILSFGSLLTYAVGNYLFVDEKGIGQALFVQFFEVLVAFAPLLVLQVTPEEGGWQTIIRRYVGLLGEGLRNRTAIWDRVMLALILIVAAMLRLTRLGNLFGSITSQSANGDALRQVSGDIRLILADARGLEGPFNLLEHALVNVFGPTPFAVLLPSAILGSLTVWLIYLVCVALFDSGDTSRARSIGLLAALLAATSGWHVSLSRSGVQVVTLPLLLCLSLYLLLHAVRLKAPAPRDTSIRRHARRGRYRRPASRAPSANVARRRMALFAASGLCAGLASDLASGLWVLPVLSIIAFLYARKRLPGWFAAGQREIGVLAATALVAGLPGLWHYSLSKYVGFAPGAPLLARSTAHPPALSLANLPARLRDILGNLGSVIHVLLAQDYSAGGPSASDAPIIPAIITPFFVLGVVLIVLRWRRVSAMTLLLLLALPLLTTIFVDAQPSVMGAATALPAMSMISAVALWEVGKWLGSLPIALDRAHGARVFANPEYIGRFVLMVFLLVSAMRTFYWYFQATLPTTPPNTFVPT